VPIQFLEQLGARLAKSVFYVRSSSRSFGWVKMVSVGQCYINQIEKGDTVGESSCLAERVGDPGDDRNKDYVHRSR
jgi:hypothetical protein